MWSAKLGSDMGAELVLAAQGVMYFFWAYKPSPNCFQVRLKVRCQYLTPRRYFTQLSTWSTKLYGPLEDFGRSIPKWMLNILEKNYSVEDEQCSIDTWVISRLCRTLSNGWAKYVCNMLLHNLQHISLIKLRPIFVGRVPYCICVGVSVNKIS